MRPRRTATRTAPLSLGQVCGICVSACLRLLFGIAAIALVGCALLYARLLQGPIAIPFVSEIVSEQVNAYEPDAKLDIGELVLSLGEGSEPSGLRFRDVRLETLSDGRVLEVPNLTASFHFSDLIRGEIQPVRISLIGPTVAVTRQLDGRFGIRIGDGTTMQPLGDGSAPSSGRDDQEEDQLSALVDGFVGDGPSLGLLEKLEAVTIVRARLTYDDRSVDEAWTSRSAGLTITRYDGGARAILTLDEFSDQASDLSLRVLADRPRDRGTTLLSAQFGRADAREIARLAPGLEWLQLVRGVVEGRSTAEMSNDGTIRNVSGVLVAEDGTVLLSEAPLDYHFARLVFEADPARQSLKIDDFTLTSDRISLRINGVAQMQIEGDGTLSGIRTQVNLSELFANPKGRFPEPLRFENGSLLAAWDRETSKVDIVSADLTHKTAAVSMSGQFRERRGAWDGGLRIGIAEITMRDLLRFWPVDAAVNARTWIDENILVSKVTDAIAHLRLGATESLNMDFTFSDLDSRYLGQMSPLKSLSGKGALTLEDLVLEVDDGYVTPKAGRSRIALGGSRVGIYGFSDPVTDTDIQIAATGDARSVLALIDEPPLRLASKFAADLSTLNGNSQIDVDVKFPLEQDLLLEQIDITATARMTDVTYDYPVNNGTSLAVAANEMLVTATSEQLNITGATTIEQQPFDLSWIETYGGGKSGSLMTLDGPVTADIAANFGLDTLGMDGTADVSLAMETVGDATPVLKIDADLKEAGIAVEDIDWKNEIGEAGRLRVEIGIDSPVQIENLRLETSDLTLAGSVRLNAEGQFAEAELSRLKLGRALDARATITSDATEGLSLTLTGRMVNLEALRERFPDEGTGESETSATPISAKLAVDTLVLRDDIKLASPTGTFERGRDGAFSARLEGALQSAAPVVATLTRNARGVGKVVLESEDAGLLLRALDLYTDASGGKLSVTADIDEDSNLDGIMRIQNLNVRSEATFRDVIRSGGFDDGVEDAVETTGLAFRKIWVPFALRNGSLDLTDAIASGSALALKVNGSIDEESGNLDLRGVISPAYGLTGALNDVPLLGTLLSGGEGEGIIAMTFTLKGPSESPELSVNPLSLLTPGFLRGIFSGEIVEPSKDFQQQLTQPEQ